MARRKKEENVSQEQLPEMEIFDGEVQLASEDLYRLLYLDSKVKYLELSRRLKAREIDDQIRQIRQSFDNFDKDIKAQRDQAFEEMHQVRKQVEEKLEIKMSEYSLDEATGKLTKLGPKEA